MNDSEFIALADKAMKSIEAMLETSTVDLDFALVSSGVLEIELADGGKIIVNRHGAAQEIWVAAKSGGFHFRWDGENWRDTRDGSELAAKVSGLVAAQA